MDIQSQNRPEMMGFRAKTMAFQINLVVIGRDHELTGAARETIWCTNSSFVIQYSSLLMQIPSF